MKKTLSLIFLPLILVHYILLAQTQVIKTEDSLLKQVAIQSNPKDQIQLYLELNNASIATGKYIKSLHYAEKALILAKESKLRTEQAKSFNSIGRSYLVLKDYTNALKNYNKALVIFQQLGDYRQQIITLYNIGQLYDTDICDYSTALDYYNRVLSIENKHNDTELKALLYLNIGALFKNSSNDKKALENLNYALDIAKQHDIKKIMTNCLSVLGNFYANKDDLPKAIKCYDQAIEIKQQIGDELGEGSDYVNLAFIYQVKSDYQTSLKYLSETFRIAQKYNANGLLLMYEKDMGLLLATAPDSILLSIGINPKKRFESAIQYELSALKLGEKINKRDQKMYILSNLYAIYEEHGDIPNAYKYYKTFISLRDSILGEEQQRNIVRQELQFEFEKKDTERKAAQEKKDTRQRTILYSSSLVMILLLIFSIVVLKQRNRTKKEKMRAEKSEKFKQQFLANMSHEIRTPMNAIMGMTRLVLDTPLNEKQQSYLNSIIKASENLLHIINEILDLSKIEAGKMELEQIDFSIRDVVEQVKQTLQHKATEKNIELISTVQSTVPEVLIGDQVRLFQILMNLVGNAIKFTEKGSVQLSVNKEQNQLRFSIIDTGIGIPQDKLRSIFESFTQAHSSDTRKYGGTGLGLSISKQLVELMGGDISIESEVGSGATFSFSINLPLGIEEKLLKQHLTEQIDGSILDGLVILLVDDNADNRIVCRDTLESKSNVEIIEATNGEEALEKLSQHDFDIVLMDIQMPVMNGYEATQQIRNNFASPKKNVPVIALTASVIRSDLDKCRRAGMNDYVPKPFKPVQLYTAIAILTKREIKFMNSKAVVQKTEQHTASQHIDLTYLENFCEGDEAKMKKYILIFLDSVPAFISKLNAAMAEFDAEEIASQVHGFKTKFVMMGMEEARLLAAQLEANCRAQSPEQTTIQTNTTTLIQIVLVAETELKNTLYLYS